MSQVEGRTVIWLNEAQLYLGSSDAGEEVAARLQELIRGTGGQPIVVLGSMWPVYWNKLMAGHNAASRLLGLARKQVIPSSFDDDDLERSAETIANDPRLRFAVTQGSRVTQHLAGGVEQVSRYEGAPSEHAKAIVQAAVDARRLGNWLLPPESFLRSAAPGYLDPDVWNLTDPGTGWFDEAIAYLVESWRGAPGILSPVRPLPDHDDRRSGLRLSDYVEQHVRRERASHYPPASFWNAALRSECDAAVLIQLGISAEQRGRKARARGLYEIAGDLGDFSAFRQLAHYHDSTGDLHSGELMLREAANLGDQRSLDLLILRGTRSAHHAAAKLILPWPQASRYADRLRKLVQGRESEGDFDSGKQFLREAAEAGYMPAYHELADRQLDAGDHRAGAATLSKAAAAEDGYALVRLADLRDRAGDAAGAEQLLVRAAAVDNVFATLELARRRMTAGDLGAAERDARYAAARGYPAALVELAEFCDDSGDESGGLKFAREAAGYGDAGALWYLARRRDATGRRELAEELAGEAAVNGYAGALWFLSMLREDAGDSVAAYEIALEAADQDGDDSALRELARRWERAGRIDEARKVGQAAIRAGGRRARWELVKCYEADGQSDAAEFWALDGSSEGGLALRELYDHRVQAGRHRHAQQLLKRAADLGDVWAIGEITKRIDAVRDRTMDEALLRRLVESGDLKALRALIRRRDAMGDPADAEKLAIGAIERRDVFALTYLARRRHEAADEAAAEQFALSAADQANRSTPAHRGRQWDLADEPHPFQALWDIALSRISSGDLDGADRLLVELADRNDLAALELLIERRELSGQSTAADELAVKASGLGYAAPLARLVRQRQESGDGLAAEALAMAAVGDTRVQILWDLVAWRDSAKSIAGSESVLLRLVDLGVPGALTAAVDRRESAGDGSGKVQFLRDQVERGVEEAKRLLVPLLAKFGQEQAARDLAREAASTGDSELLFQLALYYGAACRPSAAERVIHEMADYGFAAHLLVQTQVPGLDPDTAVRIETALEKLADE